MYENHWGIKPYEDDDYYDFDDYLMHYGIKGMKWKNHVYKTYDEAKGYVRKGAKYIKKKAKQLKKKIARLFESKAAKKKRLAKERRSKKLKPWKAKNAVNRAKEDLKNMGKVGRKAAKKSMHALSTGETINEKMKRRADEKAKKQRKDRNMKLMRQREAMDRAVRKQKENEVRANRKERESRKRGNQQRDVNIHEFNRGVKNMRQRTKDVRNLATVIEAKNDYKARAAMDKAHDEWEQQRRRDNVNQQHGEYMLKKYNARQQQRAEDRVNNAPAQVRDRQSAAKRQQAQEEERIRRAQQRIRKQQYERSQRTQRAQGRAKNRTGGHAG